jgi:beta-lactamase superfamily II metal-dependent hydrolase
MSLLVEPFPETLDRSLLQVFLFGADMGEAIAVALPERGWILVDGCRLEVGDNEVFPALEAYLELRSGDDDPVELLVWTHPHADHYLGIREAIERHRPVRVGMTLAETPVPGSASKEVEALGSHPMLPADLRLQDVFKQVKSTIERVFHYWRGKPESRLLLSAQTSPLELGATRVRAFSPDQAALKAFYSRGVEGLRAALKTQANEYSIVLGLEFGETRLVLGGDLPYRSTSGSVLSHGWKWIEENAPELAAHQGFKVSHHGSAEAIPPFFRGGTAPPPEWLVTPFAREHLPRPGEGEKGGLQQLLHRAPELRLTSSVGLVSSPEPGARVCREELRLKLAAVEAGGFSGGLRAPAASGLFDFAWGVAFDSNRAVKRLFAGRQAITVVEDGDS